MREREMGLRHADRQVAEPGRRELRRLLPRGLEQEHVVGAVDVACDRADLLLDRRVVRVGEAEVALLVGGGDDRLGERSGATPAVLEAGVDLGRVGAVLERQPADELELLRSVRLELVHRDDGVQAEVAHDPDVPRQIGGAVLDLGHAPVEVAAVVLQGAHRRDEDDRARPQPTDAAGDVEELLHPHVRRESGLRDEVLAELEPDAVCDE